MGIAQDPDMPGYESFEKQAWGFKVCVLVMKLEPDLNILSA